MAYNSTIDLDQLAPSQALKETTANNLLAALSAAALFGIKSSSGLSITFYGGNFPIAGTPTAVANQTITLTASTTNYIYTTSSGVVTKTTSIPGGWPGPLAAGAIAMYSIVTGASTITSGTCYLIGVGQLGPTGATGAQGPAGTDLAGSRKRIWEVNGAGSTVTTLLGWDSLTTSGTATARSLGSGSLGDSIPFLSYVTAAGAGSGSQVHHPRDFCYLGNASGRGGFTFSLRFRMESANSPANFRCFFGLFARVTIGNVEPDTLLDLIGVGSKAGDANLSLINNDNAGTATVTTLGANFPAKTTDNVYELVLTSVANSGTISYTLTDMGTGNQATGSVSSNIPNNTTFLSWVAWCNNGSTASAASMGLMQAIGETRY
jgi:hypothetical protein